jgi:predicted RNA binding protein YcfA (HicA-like mRNA interferase family)
MAKSYSSREVITMLEARGFRLVRTTGSHHKFVKDNRTVIVPHPRKDIKTGTLGSILRQAGIDKKDLEH